MKPLEPGKKHRIYAVSFANVYPLYLKKVERKGRTKKEVDEIIRWLFGYDARQLSSHLKHMTTIEDFVEGAPKLNPKRRLVTGVICGVRVEDIKEPVMQAVRYLDKMIDELAKGRPMDKILRKEA